MTCTSCSSFTTFFLSLSHTYFDHAVYHLFIPQHLHVWLTDSPAGLFRGWRVRGSGWWVTGDGWRVKKPLKATVSSPPTPRKLFPFGSPPPPLGISVLRREGGAGWGMDIFWNSTIQKKCNFPAQKIVRCLLFLMIVDKFATHTNNHAIHYWLKKSWCTASFLY